MSLSIVRENNLQNDEVRSPAMRSMGERGGLAS